MMSDTRKKLIERADKVLSEQRRLDFSMSSPFYARAQTKLAVLARGDMPKLIHDMRAYLCSKGDYGE